MCACDRQTVVRDQTYPQLPIVGICRVLERLDGRERTLYPLDGIPRAIPTWAFLHARSEKLLAYTQQFSGQRPPLERRRSVPRTTDIEWVTLLSHRMGSEATGIDRSLHGGTSRSSSPA